MHQHESAMGVHEFPILNPPPHTISLGDPSAPASSILYPASNLDWHFITYMILYMFQCYLLNHPTLAFSHRVQKSVLYICVFFAVSHIGSSLPSSKFLIYVLICCIHVFLSDLLHSV